MAKLTYGNRAPYLRFANDAEFFEVLGFLCNATKHNLQFQWEYNANSGAWGNEGRIHFFACANGVAYQPMPNVLQQRLTAGRGNIASRINCNDFVQELVINYGFYVNPAKPGNAITRTAQGLLPPSNPHNYVPPQYLSSFNYGYNL